MRFNHMELTFARGTLTEGFRAEVDAFYGGVFGWKGVDTEVVGQWCHILLPDADQFILLAESSKPMASTTSVCCRTRAARSTTCSSRARSFAKGTTACRSASTRI